jgi:hypothetical protein
MKKILKSDKILIANMYLFGVSKDAIYHTLKRNGIDRLTRKQIREYLKPMESNRGKFYEYTKRVKELRKSYKNKIINKRQLKKEIKGMQDNYLKHALILMLNNKKYKYKSKNEVYKRYDNMIYFNEFTNEWTSG